VENGVQIFLVILAGVLYGRCQLDNIKWCPDIFGDFCWSLIWQMPTGQYKTQKRTK